MENATVTTEINGIGSIYVAAARLSRTPSKPVSKWGRLPVLRTYLFLYWYPCDIPAFLLMYGYYQWEKTTIHFYAYNIFDSWLRQLRHIPPAIVGSSTAVSVR